MRIGLGPVFAYEWLTTSRRWQNYATRSLFVAALLIALAVVWGTRFANQSLPTIAAQSGAGVSFFYAIVGTQLSLILLVAPAATAGSICLDKARGTLSHVLVTDLSDSEIVLGKLVARLLPSLALVACTLPMMTLSSLLGGLDPDALFGAFLITLGVAVLGASLALAFSVWARKTHEVLLGTYAVWGLWLMIGPISSQLVGGLVGLLRWLDRTLRLPVSRWLDLFVTALASLEYFDPFRLAFRPYISPATAKFQDDVNFLIATFAISVVLVSVSIWKLRPAYIRSLGQSLERPKRLSSLARIERLWDVFDHLPGPSLDGNPVLWREWHLHRPSRLSRIAWLLYIVLAASFSAIAFWTPVPSAYSAWVNGMQVSIGILLLSVSASTSLAEERVRGSLDILLATPLSTFTILSGKWWGTFRLVVLLTVLPTAVALGQLLLHAGSLQHCLLVPCMIVAYGAGVTSLGLALATWVPRLGRAVGLCLTAVLLMTVGWLFLAITMTRGQAGEAMAMGSPFMGAGLLTYEISNRGGVESLNWAALWIEIYLAVAFVLFVLTWISFNQFLGRASARVFGPQPYSRSSAPLPVASRGNSPKGVPRSCEGVSEHPGAQFRPPDDFFPPTVISDARSHGGPDEDHAINSTYIC
jgi:ABC-type transport system involved in multi-copper enzyme maturation permease subunit